MHPHDHARLFERAPEWLEGWLVRIPALDIDGPDHGHLESPLCHAQQLIGRELWVLQREHRGGKETVGRHRAPVVHPVIVRPRHQHRCIEVLHEQEVGEHHEWYDHYLVYALEVHVGDTGVGLSGSLVLRLVALLLRELHGVELANELLVDSRPAHLNQVWDTPAVGLEAHVVGGVMPKGPCAHTHAVAVDDHVDPVGPEPGLDQLLLPLGEVVPYLRELGDMGIAVKNRIALFQRRHDGFLSIEWYGPIGWRRLRFRGHRAEGTSGLYACQRSYGVMSARVTAVWSDFPPRHSDSRNALSISSKGYRLERIS